MGSFNLPEVQIRLDGACAKQGDVDAKAGWGFEVVGDLEHEASGAVYGAQDSNRAEITALLEALRWASNKNVIINIKTDSAFLVSGFKHSNARIGNKDLWDQIEKYLLLMSYRIRSMKRIPRHLNKRADALAKAATQVILHLEDDGQNRGFSLEMCQQQMAQ